MAYKKPTKAIKVIILGEHQILILTCFNNKFYPNKLISFEIFILNTKNTEYSLKLLSEHETVD